MKKIDANLRGIVGLNADLAIADVSELEFLKKNARYLKQEKYQQLSDNISEDGGLTSIPLVAITESGKYEILSGNHRVKAAHQSGQEHILVLCIDEVLPREKKIAIQLSHNALEGKDDPQILKSLYEELVLLDMKKYSGVDEEIFAELEKLKTLSMTGDALKFKAITLMFLPNEIDRIKDVFDKIKEQVASTGAWLVHEEDYDRYLDAMEITKSTYDVKNTALAFTIILDNFEKTFDMMNGISTRVADEEAKKRKKTVPLIPIFDTYNIPFDLAFKLNKVMEDAISSASIKKDEKYKMLELFIDAYWDRKKVNNG